jgi:hypothetical protein
MRDAVKEAKRAKYPQGTEWSGVYVAVKEDSAVDIQDRYYWVHRTSVGLEIVVTLFHDLACYIHKATEIAVDFTFKRVLGDTNEWEVVIWSQEHRHSQYSFISTFAY